MDKFIRISEFARQLIADRSTAQLANETLQGILEAGLLRLSDIAAKMPGNEEACYKRVQRFLQEKDPRKRSKCSSTRKLAWHSMINA